MSETYDYTKIFPSIEVVNLSKLEVPISTNNGFSKAITELALSSPLPKLFPRIPDISNKNKTNNIVMNREYQESLLRLPIELYDSKTYEHNLVLRGPMEEIILANEKERAKCGFSRNQITGDDWSQHFKERLENLKPKIGAVELNIISDQDKDETPKKNLKGNKIA